MTKERTKLYFYVAFMLLIGIDIACGQFSQPTKKIFDEIYSSEKLNKEAASDLIDKINQNNFERESHKVMALLQVRSLTEDDVMMRDAINLAKSFIDSGANASEKDLVKIGLSAIYSLNGERLAGCQLAEETLRNVDFNQLVENNTDYVNYISSRYNMGSISPQRFLKDELRRQIGGYYMNRKNDEGGPDFQKAYDVFSQITLQEVRDSCLSDARLKGLKQSASMDGTVGSDSETPTSKNQASEENVSETQPRPLKHAQSPKQSEPKHYSNGSSDAAAGPPLWQWVAGVCFLALTVLLIRRVSSRTSTKSRFGPH